MLQTNPGSQPQSWWVLVCVRATGAEFVGAAQTEISLVTVGPGIVMVTGGTVVVIVCVTVGPGMTDVITSPSSVTVTVIGGRTVVMTSVIVDAGSVVTSVTLFVIVFVTVAVAVSSRTVV